MPRIDRYRRLPLAAFLLLPSLGLAAGCGGAGAAVSTPVAGSPAELASGAVAATPWFVFHSDPSVNLHHVLYFQAAVEEARAAGEQRRLGEGPGDLERLEALPEAERAAWRRAVELYRRELAHRDMLFDDDMVAARNALARGGVEELARATAELDLPADLPTVLAAAAAVYRARLWPEHDRINREWIRAALPLLERHGEAVAGGISRAWDEPWPDEPIRTDVSVYGFWPGAYTSNRPDHIVVSSVDLAHAGVRALESLFHEASHTLRFEQGLLASLDAAFEPTGVPPPRNLWHILLFHTAGRLSGQVLAAAGEPGYEPHALREGVVGRLPGSRGHWEALDTHWRPFLEGRGTREEALAALARAIAAEAPSQDRPPAQPG